MNLDELRDRPLFTLNVDEFLFVNNYGKEQVEKNEPKEVSNKKFVYGYNGIANLFGCSKATAARIKLSGKIDKAITQIGRKIIIDSEYALELAGKKNGGRTKV